MLASRRLVCLHQELSIKKQYEEQYPAIVASHPGDSCVEEVAAAWPVFTRVSAQTWGGLLSEWHCLTQPTHEKKQAETQVCLASMGEVLNESQSWGHLIKNLRDQEPK